MEGYKRLNLKNGQKWTENHVSHLEDGIVANENELMKKVSKEDLPDVSNFTTQDEVQQMLETVKVIALTTEEILNICKI